MKDFSGLRSKLDAAMKEGFGKQQDKESGIPSDLTDWYYIVNDLGTIDYIQKSGGKPLTSMLPPDPLQFEDIVDGDKNGRKLHVWHLWHILEINSSPAYGKRNGLRAQQINGVLWAGNGLKKKVQNGEREFDPKEVMFVNQIYEFGGNWCLVACKNVMRLVKLLQATGRQNWDTKNGF